MKNHVMRWLGGLLGGDSWRVTRLKPREGWASQLQKAPLSLYFPVVVKEQPAVGRELMAQKDFTETLSEIYVLDKLFFSLLKFIFLFSKVSAFSWEQGQEWG